MNQSNHIPNSFLPDSHRWTLWSRIENFWRIEATNTREKIELFEHMILNETPERETVILPPNEKPYEPSSKCHRKQH